MSRSARAAPDHRLWLLNVALLSVVAAGYLRHAPAPRSLAMGAYLYLGVVSCAATISLLPGLLLVVLARVGVPARLREWLAASLWTLVALALFLDTQLYGIFRYHFNGMVWNVLTTPGADEAVHLSRSELALVGCAALALLLLELLALRRLRARHVRAGEERGFLRPGRIWRCVLVPVMLLHVGLHARADLVRDREVMSLSRLYPILPRVTVKRFARDWLGYELEDRPRVAFAEEGILLDYPKEPVALPGDGPTPNIVMVVVDSLRSDVLAPETMPRTSALAARARVFRDHLSGGNGTRFGVFGLLYGLHGSYWRWIYQEQRSPVLVDALLARGYETTVMTSASMSYPEFRSTAWARVEGSVEERLRGTREGGRDDGVSARFEEWLGERADPARPFFAFLLLDAPHQGYAFPEEFARFRPYAKDLSYLELARGPSAEELEAVENRYRNAVLYADDVVGRVVDALAGAGELESSLVLITGDHGEAFGENGFVGHTSTFTRAQLQVPLVWLDPELGPGVVEHPTSHLDVPATLLERLGLDPALRPSWSLGGSLFEADPSRARVAAGWDSLGVVLADERILEIPMESYGGSSIEVRDASWRPVPDADRVLAANGPLLGRLALDCRRFLR